MSLFNSPLFRNSFLGLIARGDMAQNSTFMSGSNNAQDPKYNPDDPVRPTTNPSGIGVRPRGVIRPTAPFSASVGTGFRQPVGGYGNSQTVLEPQGGAFGGAIPEFEEGGLMTEDGRAIPPPPSAGIGRTLPSARFKVEPVPPPGMPYMPATMPVMGSAPELGAQETAEFMPPEALEGHIAQADPQAVERIRAIILHAIQTGQLSEQELNTLVQLAKLAMNNPASWGQIRQFALKNGLGTEEDIPKQYDQGLVFTILLMGKALQQGGNAMLSQAPSAEQQPKAGLLPSYGDGGPTGDRAHLAKLHPREYVFPERAVLHYGLDKLNKMVAAVPDE